MTDYKKQHKEKFARRREKNPVAIERFSILMRYRHGSNGAGERGAFAEHIARKLCTSRSPNGLAFGIDDRNLLDIDPKDIPKVEERDAGDAPNDRNAGDAPHNRDFSSLKGDDLRDELRKRGLPVGGTNAELIDRLEG